MTDQPLDEVHQLKHRLEQLETRISSVEMLLHLAPPELTPLPATPLVPTEASTAGRATDLDRVLRITHGESENTPIAFVSESVSSGESTAPEQSNQTLETKIGLFWLNKLGVGSLVVGMALLLLYSFQYFGPWMKIASGYGVALALFAVATWVERRQSMTWYSNSLFGGGWALTYFTCFAMGFVPAVRVIENQVLDLSGLLLIAALATTHSIRKNAEVMSILCVSLALLTITLSPVLEFSFGASAILAVMISYVAASQKWYRFLFVGTVFSLISLFCIYPQILGSNWFYITEPPAKILFAVLLPLICWLAFNTAFLFLKSKQDTEAKLLTATATLNTLGAISICSIFLQPQFANTPFLPWLVLAIGYTVHAKLSSGRDLQSLLHLDVLAALLTFNIGLALQLSHTSLDPTIEISIWLVQILILTFAGLSNDIKSMRWFALGLGLVGYVSALTTAYSSVDPAHIISDRIMLVIAIMVSACCSFLHRKQAGVQGDIEKFLYGNVHLTAGALLLTAVPYTFDFAGWWDLWFVVSSVILVSLGIKTQYPYCRLLGNIGVVLNSLSLYATSPNWTNTHAIPRIALLYTTGSFYGKSSLDIKRDQPEVYRAAYLILAGFELAVLTVLNAPANWIVLLLMLEGVVFLSAGLSFRDKVLRITGDCFVALGIVRPLLYTSEWTVLRMLPMIGILYLIAYAYERYCKDLSKVVAVYYRHVYTCTATVLLTLLIITKFPIAWVTPSIGLEGLALLGTGFIARDKVLRVLGLSVFGILICKLLFVDFAGAATVHRIFSFIVAGLVLLLASYTYGRFAKRFVD